MGRPTVGSRCSPRTYRPPLASAAATIRRQPSAATQRSVLAMRAVESVANQDLNEDAAGGPLRVRHFVVFDGADRLRAAGDLARRIAAVPGVEDVVEVVLNFE